MENPYQGLYQFSQTYRGFSGFKGIICQVSSDEKDFDQTKKILNGIYKEISDPKLSELATAEILAKVLAYRNLKKGQKLSIPVVDTNSKIQLANYEVDKIFHLQNQTYAFGLVNETHIGAPLLIFRGTDLSLLREGGRASIISDLDPKGPGRTLFEKTKESLHEWLQTTCIKKGKARAIGHSLGGIILTYVLLHDTSFMSTNPHEPSFAFNFPGVSRELLTQWNALAQEKRPIFKGVVCRGDLISKFGLLFGELYEASFIKKASIFQAHEQLIFAKHRSYLQAVDLKAENDSPSRKFYSKFQEQTASMIYEFGLKFLFPR